MKKIIGQTILIILSVVFIVVITVVEVKRCGWLPVVAVYVVLGTLFTGILLACSDMH